MARALIALGSNLGDRAATLDAAVVSLEELPGTRVLQRSTWRESAPVGGPAGQQSFLNGAVLVATDLQPLALLDHLQQIEAQAGRRRVVRWGPRTLDLDLLLYDERSIANERLVIPHPRMFYRRFVLEPSAEIAPDLLHPTTGTTVAQLLENLNSTPRYLALLGPPGSGKTPLVKELARKSGCRQLLDSEKGVGSFKPRKDPLVFNSQELPTPFSEQTPAGPDPAGEIELLARRARRLAAEQTTDKSSWMISDFWLPQALAWAEALAGESLRLQVEAALAGVAAETPAARFVVALDLGRPNDAATMSVLPGSAAMPVAETADADANERLRAAMRRLVRQRGSPPVIWLSSGDWQGAVTELEAVIADE